MCGARKLREGAGRQKKTKEECLCFHAIHQIPLSLLKPRYLLNFHTSFIKLRGFDLPSPRWGFSLLDVCVDGVSDLSGISGHSALPRR